MVRARIGSLAGFSWHGRVGLAFRPKPSGGRAPRGLAPARSPRRPSVAAHCPMRHRSVLTPSTGCGNVSPLVIGYASRPRLRSRLTPGGLSLPGNPWTYGVRVFHPHFRILMPAFSFPVPPARIASRLPWPAERSPTTPCGVHDFGDVLSPDHFWRGVA